MISHRNTGSIKLHCKDQMYEPKIKQSSHTVSNTGVGAAQKHSAPAEGEPQLASLHNAAAGSLPSIVRYRDM
jgi:hypothetical protein